MATIDIDLERMKQPLTIRERIAIKILLLIFHLIAPTKYQHQVDKLTNDLFL